MVHDGVDEETGFGEGECGYVLEFAESEVGCCFFVAARTFSGAGVDEVGHLIRWCAREGQEREVAHGRTSRFLQLNNFGSMK